MIQQIRHRKSLAVIDAIGHRCKLLSLHADFDHRGRHYLRAVR
jgi:hypothetical protein